MILVKIFCSFSNSFSFLKNASSSSSRDPHSLTICWMLDRIFFSSFSTSFMSSSLLRSSSWSMILDTSPRAACTSDSGHTSSAASRFWSYRGLYSAFCCSRTFICFFM